MKNLWIPILVALLLPVFVILALRAYGLTASHKTRIHPYLHKEQKILIKLQTKESLKDYERLQDKAILDISIVFKDKLRLEPKILPLEDLFQKYPQALFFVRLLSNEEKINQKWIEMVDKYQLQDRTAHYSTFGMITNNLRELKPRWIHVASPNEAHRFYLLSRFFLEVLADMDADIYMIPYQFEGSFWFENSMANEIHRRNKLFYIDLNQSGWQKQKMPFEQADALSIDQVKALPKEVLLQ